MGWKRNKWHGLIYERDSTKERWSKYKRRDEEARKLALYEFLAYIQALKTNLLEIAKCQQKNINRKAEHECGDISLPPTNLRLMFIIKGSTPDVTNLLWRSMVSPSKTIRQTVVFLHSGRDEMQNILIY